MIEINKNPSRRDLMWFGALLAVFFAVIGSLAHWRFGAPNVAYVLWCVGGTLTVIYYAVAPLRRPLYLGWLYAAYPIGWTVSHLVLALTYYVVMTPIGIIMRLVGYDPMQRKIDRQASSYWIERPETPDPSQYFRQF